MKSLWSRLSRRSKVITVVGVVLGLAAVGSASGAGNTPVTTEAQRVAAVNPTPQIIYVTPAPTVAAVALPSSTASASLMPQPTPVVTPRPTATPAPTRKPTPTPKPTPELTLEQENAIGTAEDYLDYAAFSRSGLIRQLEYEGYSKAVATFAVDHVTVNWNEQAYLSAEEYLAYSHFSRSGLIDQLEYEGFTKKQATYGVTKAGL